MSQLLLLHNDPVFLGTNIQRKVWKIYTVFWIYWNTEIQTKRALQWKKIVISIISSWTNLDHGIYKTVVWKFSWRSGMNHWRFGSMISMGSILRYQWSTSSILRSLLGNSVPVTCTLCLLAESALLRFREQQKRCQSMKKINSRLG